MNKWLEQLPLKSNIKTQITTGDLQDEFNNVEIYTPDDILFELDFNQNKEIQFVVYQSNSPYKIPLEELKRLLKEAEHKLKATLNRTSQPNEIHPDPMP
jgi:hypothetical protein